MTDLILNALRCPICHTPMTLENGGKSMMCRGEGKRHCYDLSSSGYVNFVPPAQCRSGDSKEAVRSRTGFLNEGFYAPILEAVTEVAERYVNGLLVDAGCGEGYYSSALADVCEGVVGFDLSKFGVDAAAKRTKNKADAFFGVAGIYDMPLMDSCANGVVSIFAPCAEEEFSRIMKKDAPLIVVGAGKDHLLGLKQAIYETTYENAEREDMPKGMTLTYETEVSYSMTLDNNRQILDLFSMTPYYYRTGEQDMQKLKSLEHLTTPVDVLVRVYHKK